MPKSKLEKQKEAEDRALIRSKRSHKDQISRLDSLFGKEKGAIKERTRLISLIEKHKSPKEEIKEEKTKRKKKIKE